MYYHGLSTHLQARVVLSCQWNIIPFIDKHFGFVKIKGVKEKVWQEIPMEV